MHIWVGASKKTKQKKSDMNKRELDRQYSALTDKKEIAG